MTVQTRYGPIEVVNVRRAPPGGEYVGRPSDLGNTFRIGLDGTRDEVIVLYRRWLAVRPPGGRVDKALGHLLTLLRRDGRLTLRCWCAPFPCHADVIAAEVARLAAEESP